MKNTLIVVADLGLFRAYLVQANELQRTPRLELIEEFGTREAHTQRSTTITVMERRSGKAPANRQSSGTASDGEKHNMELEKRSRLARHVAETLERLLANEEVEACFFAAPAEIDRQILQALGTRARNKIEKNLTLDLAKVPKANLLRRFGIGPTAWGNGQLGMAPATRRKISGPNRSYTNRPIGPLRGIPVRAGIGARLGSVSEAGGPAGSELGIRRGSVRKPRPVINHSSDDADATATGKRRRGEPAMIGGFTGKEAAQWSAYRGNMSNVKRKPGAPSVSRQESPSARRQKSGLKGPGARTSSSAESKAVPEVVPQNTR